MGMICWRPFEKSGEFVTDRLYWPDKGRKPIDILCDFPLFARQDQQVDVLLAVVASVGQRRFFYDEVRGRSSYLARLQKRSKNAARDYEKRMRAHFKKNKMFFLEGYSLPGPPTPQIRAIYDSAAQWENRPVNPDGTTLQKGFSLGEFHWRKWPLDNLYDLNSDWEKRESP